MEDFTELSFSNVIVVTNLPSGVTPEKQGKLQSFLSKVVSSDPSADIIDVHFPLDSATSATLGIAIVTLSDESIVAKVIERVDGFEVSKGQALRAFPFDVAESILEDAAAVSSDSSVLDRSQYRDWIRDEPRMEQLLTRFDDETEIYWVDPLDPLPKLYYGGEREKVGGKKWCDLNVSFSPNGSYLLTLHGPGVAVWGGPQFGSKTRFEHSHVSGAIFSPNEEYLLTFRHPMSSDDREVVKVWQVLNGELLRSFGSSGLVSELNESGFAWSASSNYLARIVNGAVFVYETPTMQLARQAPLRYENVKVVSWAPVGDWLAVWTPETSNEPGSLVVVDAGTRAEVTTKKLFSTGDAPAEVWWHPEADYLALKASRLLSRSKKSGKTVFEVIRLRENNCPSDAIENISNVVSVSWEPCSSRFALIMGEDKKVVPSATCPTGIVTEFKLKLYTLAAGKPLEEPKKDSIVPLMNGSFNRVEWSPNGQHFVLFQGPVQSKPLEISAYSPDRKTATTGNPNGELLFYSATSSGVLELMCKEEHMNMNRAIWDPSGRFLVTAVQLNVHEKNAPSYKMEQYSGYYLWTFQGRNLRKVEGVRLWNVEWRPHVQGAVSSKEKKMLVKSLREKSVVFEEEDRKVKNAKKSNFQSGFQAKQDVFDLELAAIDEHFEERIRENPKWAALYAA